MSEPGSPPEVKLVTDRPQPDDRGTVLAVEGEVDMLTANQFRVALEEALLDRPRVLVVDLSGLAFLGSVGLSQLVEASVAAGPGVMRVVARDGPRRSIEVTGLDEVLAVADTVEKAFGTEP